MHVVLGSGQKFPSLAGRLRLPNARAIFQRQFDGRETEFPGDKGEILPQVLQRVSALAFNLKPTIQ